MRIVASAVLAVVLVLTTSLHAGLHLLELRHHHDAGEAWHALDESDGDCQLCHAGTPPEVEALAAVTLPGHEPAVDWPEYGAPILRTAVDHCRAGRAPPAAQV